MYKINYETIGGGKKIVSKRMIGAAAAEALESKENMGECEKSVNLN